MFISDINDDDLQEAIGSCLNDRAFRIFGRAARLLTEKQLIDQLVGEISVCVCDGFITLPPEVDTVLGIQTSGHPSIIRNQWFDYHINGPGDRGWTSCGYADILGNQFCTIREPDRAVQLVINIRAAQDANKKFRVYGWAENGERIHAPDSEGKMQDGFYVPTMFGSLSPATDVAPIVKIERISKEDMVDFCDLYAVVPGTTEAISLLGTYRPVEKTPAYTRIRVSAENVVRVKFRRKDFEVTSRNDWINTDNIEAFLLACQAVDARMKKKYGEAAVAEGEAVRLMRATQSSRRPGGVSPPQVVVSATNCGSRGLFYG